MKKATASLLCLLLGSCFTGPDDLKLEIRETVVSDHTVGSNFSMHLQDTRLYMIYPSVDALSLNLISAELSRRPLRPVLGETKYLDRISYSPDIGEDFGRHLFLHDDRHQHILYVDREGEENSVLKWLSKITTDDTWWIDAFPGLAEPLAAIPEQGGSLQVVVSGGTALSLYRLQPEGQPLRLATAPAPAGAFRPVGRIHVVRQGEYWAFTVYDDRSKRLYLVHPGRDTLGKDSLTIEAVHTSGEVHYSTILDNRLYILLFDTATSSIVLLERAQRSFEVLPVTLCEGTGSVFLTTYAGDRLFLFNERVIDQREKTSYQLSLLYPESGGDRYAKLALVRGDGNIRGFTALQAADTLYVLYLRGDTLSLLAVSLEKLAGSPEGNP